MVENIIKRKSFMVSKLYNLRNSGFHQSQLTYRTLEHRSVTILLEQFFTTCHYLPLFCRRWGGWVLCKAILGNNITLCFPLKVSPCIYQQKSLRKFCSKKLIFITKYLLVVYAHIDAALQTQKKQKHKIKNNGNKSSYRINI